MKKTDIYIVLEEIERAGDVFSHMKRTNYTKNREVNEVKLKGHLSNAMIAANLIYVKSKNNNKVPDKKEKECTASPKVHQLEIIPEYYQAVIEGRKKAELRKNDRDYSIGDYLLLTEWDFKCEVYTGRKVTVEVTDITLCDFAAPNFVMLSFDGIDSINIYSFDGGIPF
ncbi:putative exported phage-related protein [Yersinia enterocolitica]|nr:putative exported phage-related protein [Yersinia enterocolitica]